MQPLVSRHEHGLLCGAALAAAAVSLWLLERRRKAQMLEAAKKELALVAEERRSERAGRTKAERELRELQLRLSQLKDSEAPDLSGSAECAGSAGSSAVDLQQIAFPMRPVGILRSCFSRRNGTPRQPLLVPGARAALTLRPDLSADFLAGVQQYSHVWVLFVFHCNTDLQRLWQAGAGVRGKIRVPRLDGERLGVFATRSPHRPCPIGLSVAQVVGVRGRTLILGGADIVDGSPVLDIKPYVPFCDAVPAAAAPPWVAPEAEEEPLQIAGVEVPAVADAALAACWRRRGKRSLYASYPEFRQFVVEVLSRDIRSVTQRVKVPRRQQAGLAGLNLAASGGSSTGRGGGGGGSSGGAGAGGGSAGTGAACNSAAEQLAEGYWHVALDGIDISYEVGEDAVVQLRTARLLE